MKIIYTLRLRFFLIFSLAAVFASAQTPTTITQGSCESVIANFNNNDNGFNSPSIYGSIFDSSFYYHAGRGYWTDYLPPHRVNPPGFPRVLNIISPPYVNPNPSGTFNVGFYYICGNPTIDRFQVRIVSVTETPMGTVTNVEATSGVQFLNLWNTPTPYIDNGPDATPLLNGFEGYVCIRLLDPDIVNAPNTTFRVEISFIINEPLFAVFDNLSIGSQQIPLPVNFIGLIGERENNTVNLKWDVSEEIDVLEYQVERSEDGRTFVEAGKVPAHGKSIYTFTHNNAPDRNLYYRIRSVDLDGSFEYSGILRIAAGKQNSASDQVIVYPSPAQSQVTVQHRKLQRGARMMIMTMDGKLLKTITPAIGNTNTFISISDLRPGLYMLRLEDGTGLIQSTKFIRTE
jgi:hypothetical protein